MSYDNYHIGSASVPNQADVGRIKVEDLLSSVDIFHPHASKQHMFGTIAEARDGRKFRYQKNSSAAVRALANISQSALATANWVDEPQTEGGGAVAASVGDKAITLLVQTEPTKDGWVDGYMWVENGDGEGAMYVIKEHTQTTNPKVTIADAGGFRIATKVASTPSDISILANPYANVIAFPTSPSGICTGVNLTAVPKSYYFWGQVHGPCPVVNGTDDVQTGDLVMAGSQAAGVLGRPDDASNDEGMVYIGYVMRGSGEDGETLLIFLTIE